MKRLEGRPFVLLGVNSDSKERIVKRMVEEQITWPFFWDGGNTRGPIATAWNVKSWPMIYLIDANGIIRFKNVAAKDLDAAVDQLLTELEGNR